MRSKFTVAVDLKKADVKVLEQIKREQFPELPNIDAVAHIIASRGIQNEIFRQHGKNLARHLKSKKLSNTEIKEELEEKNYNSPVIKEIFNWLARELKKQK